MEKSHCIVVGGGLVGGLLSVVLARRGHRVDVFEKRGDLRLAQAAGRSINLVVTSRGIEALKRAGLEDALGLTVPVTGRQMHGLDGRLTFQPYGRDGECNYSISRNALNQFLLEASEKAGAQWHWEHPLSEIHDTTCTFARGDGPVNVKGDWVFGTDGAGSQMRASLQAQGLVQSTTDFLAHGYRELEIPALPGGGFALEKTALHIWPRGSHMLMALPNQDGSFTVTLYLEQARFEEMASGAGAESYFEEFYPDAISLLEDLPAQWSSHPVGRLGTVRCDPWHGGGRVLLLGDASHAIVPFFGQGMNSGFEDVSQLEQSWDQLQNLDGLAAFSAERKKNADAIADMALENFVEMRDRVGDPKFLRRKQWEQELETAFPHQYRSRYGMVTYTLIPYHVVQEVGRYQQTWLDEKVASHGLAAPVPIKELGQWVQGELAAVYRQHGL